MSRIKRAGVAQCFNWQPNRGILTSSIPGLIIAALDKAGPKLRQGVDDKQQR
jgi:hypothetical protein